MKRIVLLLVLITCTAGIALAGIAAGPYYARGDFYCAAGMPGSPDSCWGYAPELQLYDDGMHEDGAPNDGVYARRIVCNQAPGLHYFKIANADWTFNLPNVPGYPVANGELFTSVIGESVLFRLDTSTPPYGWLPSVSVSNDHAYPAGDHILLSGSAPELAGPGLTMDHDGPLWSRLVTIAAPGTYQYMFPDEGFSVFFGQNYNASPGYQGTFTTTTPNEDMIIQFDESTGRIRAIANDNVPVKAHSWGSLKARYR